MLLDFKNLIIQPSGILELSTNTIHMKHNLILVLVVAFFPVMVVFDYWFFQNYLGVSYIGWYVDNGTFISIVASLFAVIWKDMNRNENLISANPRSFLSANLILLGTQLQILGQPLQRAEQDFQKGQPLSYITTHFIDALAGLLATLFIVAALIVWFFAVVPLQYFVVLVAGAPARLALKHGNLLSSQDTSNALVEWERNFQAAPVS